MSLFRYLTTLAAIFALLSTPSALASAKGHTGRGGSSYRDIPGGHWAAVAVEELTGLGIFPGKGRFDGSKQIIRYDVFIAVDKLLETSGVYAKKRIKPGKSPFSDVVPDTMVVKPMSRLSSLGLVNGGPRGLARGMDRLTRYEAATFLAGLLPLLQIDLPRGGGSGGRRFKDMPPGHWAEAAAAALAESGISRWKTGENFRGEDGVSRYEMAYMLWMARKKSGDAGVGKPASPPVRKAAPPRGDSKKTGPPLSAKPGSASIPRISRSKFFSIIADCRDSGKSYVYGKWDCSRFVQHVFGKLGIELPRMSKDQARAGAEVKVADLKPGDLLFFDHRGRGEVTHSGIFLGPEGGDQFSFIHNSTRAGKVIVDDLSRKEHLGKLLWVRRVANLR